MVGDDLRAAGIRIFPVHGVDNVKAIVDSEIAAALGMRMAVLSDDASVQRFTSGQPANRGERAVSRLLREAAAVDFQVKAVGLTRPDILWYLDEEVCRQAAPHFPGWAAAHADQAAAHARRPWKRWITSRYDLSLTRDSIRALAAECRVQGRIPTELARVIQELAAYASG
jgi:hypothetical protein